MEKYNIILPDNLIQIKELTDISFMQKASKSIGDSIDDQFVIVQVHDRQTNILIYSLKDTQRPVVKFMDLEFSKCRFAFFARKNKQTISFILMSGWNNTYYVIDYNESQGPVRATKELYSIKNDDRIICEENYQIYDRSFDMQIDPLEIVVQISKTESFVQSYFINCKGNVILIYPYQEKLQKRKVIEFIQNKHGINGKDQVHSLYFNDEINYLNIKQNQDEILNFLAAPYQQIRNFESKNVDDSHFIDIKGSINNNINTQRIFIEDLVIIMSFDDQLETLSFSQEQAYSLKEQKIENYRKDFEKEINDHENGKQNQLQNQLMKKLIYQFDSQEHHNIYQNNYRLYNASTVNQYINNFYLNSKLKNVFSTHNQCFIGKKVFKFQQNFLLIDLSSVKVNINEYFQLVRLYSDYDECKNLKLVQYFVTLKSVIFFFMYRKDDQGFYFMVPINLNSLQKEYIINRDSKFIYFENNRSINIEKFDTETINRLKSDDKDPSFTKQQLIFDIVKDNFEPTKQFIPFIFHSKVAKQMFDHYFCWMDADKICEIDLNHKQINEFQFTDYIFCFKIDYYQRLDEPDQFSSCTEENSGMRMDVLSKGRFGQNMFTRSSNWQTEVQGNKYKARYMVANNIKAGGIESIEIKEFMVHLDFQQKAFAEVKLIQMKYLTFNEEYISSVRSSQDNLNPIENNRLIPKIDDNGKRSGVLALISNKQALFGIYTIKSDIQLIKDLYFDKQLTQKLLIENISKNVHLQQINKNTNTYEGFLSDGTFIKGLKQEIFTSQIKDEPAHDYYSFDITDHENDYKQLNSIQNDIVHMNVKQNKFGYLTTIKLSQKSIDSKYFNDIEANYWLYQYSKTALTLKMSHGFDYLFDDQNDINYQIFQPQYKLNGKNKLSLILQDISLAQIDQLLELIKKKDKDFTYMKNSVLYCSQNKKKKKPLLRLINSLEISHYYDLKSDMLNLQSVIHFLHESNQSNELKHLIGELLLIQKQRNISTILINELPCLMINKYEFYDFFDIDQEESKIIHNKQEKKLYCNLETFFQQDNEISDFGQKKVICLEAQNLQNNRLTKDEMLQQLKKYKENEENQNVQVEYSYIDFTHFCRMMNMYKLQDRLHEIIEDKDLLILFKNEEVLQFSQLMLCNLINFYQDDPQIFQQNTIQTLINSQFHTITKPWIIKLMFFYFFGFLFPFTYNNISGNLISYTFKGQPESKYHSDYRFFNYFLSGFTLLVFCFLELIEIRLCGFKKYLSNGYNFFNFIQPFMFISHLILKNYVEAELGPFRVFDNLIQIIVVFGGFSKMLEFIRIKEQYCLFVNIFNRVLYELQPFIIAFFLFTAIFGFIIILMQAEAEETDNYTGLNLFFYSFIQVFRTSLGSDKLIKYEKWNKSDSFSYNLSVIIVWLSWIMNLVIMQIILLNIVIAQVSQSFEKEMSNGKSSIYKERADLNQYILQILFFFNHKKQFSALILQKPYEYLNKEMDEFTTFSEKIKQSVKSHVDLLGKNIAIRFNNYIKDLKNDFRDDMFEIQKKQKEQAQDELKSDQIMKNEFKKQFQLLKNENHILKNDIFNEMQILKQEIQVQKKANTIEFKILKNEILKAIQQTIQK